MTDIPVQWVKQQDGRNKYTRVLAAWGNAAQTKYARITRRKRQGTRWRLFIVPEPPAEWRLMYVADFASLDAAEGLAQIVCAGRFGTRLASDEEIKAALIGRKSKQQYERWEQWINLPNLPVYSPALQALVKPK